MPMEVQNQTAWNLTFRAVYQIDDTPREMIAIITSEKGLSAGSMEEDEYIVFSMAQAATNMCMRYWACNVQVE